MMGFFKKKKDKEKFPKPKPLVCNKCGSRFGRGSSCDAITATVLKMAQEEGKCFVCAVKSIDIEKTVE